MSSIHRLAGPPFRNLLSYGLEVVIRGFLRSPLRWLMCRAQDDFSVLTLLMYVCIRLLSSHDPDVGLSALGCDVEHTFSVLPVRPQVCCVLVC